jgi:ABC-2 type transport system permease protein
MTFQQQMIAFSTLTRKEITRFIRIWSQTLLPPVITTTLYLLIFGHFIGGYIGKIGGSSYIAYLVPGLIMMAIINSAYANVVSSFFGARFQRFIEELLISPMPNALILLGYVTGGVLRGMLVGLLVTIVSLFFTNLPIQHFGLMLIVVLLSATLFSVAGFINAIYAKKFDDIGIVPTFILTPLTYLGGVFYSVSFLPPFWHTISLFNPVLYMINAFRFTMIGVSDISFSFALSMLIIVTAALFGWALWLLNKGVGIRG